MKKIDGLRAHLTAALPELARDPEALEIYVTGGSLAARHGPNLGFEIRYTAHLVLLNYRGDPEQVFLPVVLWIRQNQAELILNHETGVRDIAFSVDVMDNQAVDVEIHLPLSEAVDVLPQEDGSYRLTVRDEVLPEDMRFDPAVLLRQIWTPDSDLSGFLVGDAEG